VLSLTPCIRAHQGDAVVRTLANTDPALRHCWHPVARSGDVTDQPHGVMLLGEPWALYRVDGLVRAVVDRCPHRHCPLTLGRCEAGILRCAYHGWRFDKDGRCIEIPALGARADRATLELRRVLGDLVAAVEAGPR
jgi:vanillate O-demethylase monooxygenase subunit